jgi:hypothetical protein
MSKLARCVVAPHKSIAAAHWHDIVSYTQRNLRSAYMASLPVFLLVAASLLASAVAHDGHASTCVADSVPPLLVAPYAAGLITVDGNDKDWNTIPGTEFALRQVLGNGLAYPGGDGDATIKVGPGKEITAIFSASAW